jgi:hypothetical protein
MLWDLRHSPHSNPRIAIYTQISAGTLSVYRTSSLYSATYSDVHADVLGHTHPIPIYAEIDIIAGSQSAVRRIAM